MMQIIPINDSRGLHLIREILISPKLYEAAGYEKDPELFFPDTSFQYLLIQSQGHIIGCHQYRALSNRLIECHINILPEYWGIPDLALNASILGLNWVKKHTQYRTGLTDVPEECSQVHNLCKQIGWIKIGELKDAVVYNKKLQNLILYQYNM